MNGKYSLGENGKYSRSDLNRDRRAGCVQDNSSASNQPISFDSSFVYIQYKYIQTNYIYMYLKSELLFGDFLSFVCSVTSATALLMVQKLVTMKVAGAEFSVSLMYQNSFASYHHETSL